MAVVVVVVVETRGRRKQNGKQDEKWEKEGVWKRGQGYVQKGN